MKNDRICPKMGHELCPKVGIENVPLYKIILNVPFDGETCRQSMQLTIDNTVLNDRVKRLSSV
jgi:hypothetical protein